MQARVILWIHLFSPLNGMAFCMSLWEVVLCAYVHSSCMHSVRGEIHLFSPSTMSLCMHDIVGVNGNIMCVHSETSSCDYVAPLFRDCALNWSCPN